MTIAGVSLGSAIFGTFGSEARALVLRFRTPGTRGVDINAGTNPSHTDYSCRGYQVPKLGRVPSRLVRTGMRVFGIYGDSPALLGTGVEPRANDKIVVDGVTWDIYEVTNGPQKAVFLCFTTGHG